MNFSTKRNVILLGILLCGAGVYALLTTDKLGFAAETIATYEELLPQDFSEAELGKLASLHQNCFEEDRRNNLLKYFVEVSYPHSDSYTRTMLKERVESMIQQARLTKKESLRHLTKVGVMRKNNAMIGLYSCAPESTLAAESILISNVCIAEDMRDKGFGKKLMKSAIADCKESGKDLILTVYKDHAYIFELDKKLGFVQIPMPETVGDDFNYFNKYLMVYRR